MTRIGRDLLLQLMEALQIPYLFGNPGTTELPIIDGCTRHPYVRYITALHEAVAVGMAMGYARQSGRPGVALLHVTPGLANGMGNIFNAHRAGIPLVVIAGQHHSDLLISEPILSGDSAGQVRSMSKWSHEVRHVREWPIALQRAFNVAATPPTGVVVLSVPYDVMLAPSPPLALPVPIAAGFCAEEYALRRIAESLLEAERPLIVAGDGIGNAGALDELASVAESAGVGVVSEALPTRQNFDNRHTLFCGYLPLVPGRQRELLSAHDLLFFAGVDSQAAFPFYDEAGSIVPAHTKVVYLHHNPWEIGKNYSGPVGAWGEPKVSLAKLADMVQALRKGRESQLETRLRDVRARARQRRERIHSDRASATTDGKSTVAQLAGELVDLLPRDGRFTIVNESVSNTGPFLDHLSLWEPDHYLAGKGGGLGHGMSQAIGVALADPSRQVVSLVGDGTLLYYPQAFYSAVRAGAKLLFIVVNNHSYHVLKQGLKSLGGPWSPMDSVKYPDSLDIDAPADILQLAAAFGVPGERVANVGEVAPALQKGMAATEPYVVEVMVDN